MDNANNADYHLLPAGTLIGNGKYRLDRCLGEGGFGITYLGYDVRLNRKVAVKEFYMERGCFRQYGDPNVYVMDNNYGQMFYRLRDEFVKEAQILAQLDAHPGVVRVITYEEENQTAYIIMDFVEGESLGAYLARQEQGRIPPQKVFDIMRPVIQALAGIHQKQIIHRDISPDNIMLTKNNRVKLIDFGAARGDGEYNDRKVSKGGYTPIEQKTRDGQIGTYSDIYALCATIYKCITGTAVPESGGRVANDTCLPPSAFGVSITEKQEETLMMGLAVNPAARIQNAADLYYRLYVEETDEIKSSSRSTHRDAEDRTIPQEILEQAAATGGQYAGPTTGRQTTGGQYAGQATGGQMTGQTVGGQYAGQTAGGQMTGGQYAGQATGGQMTGQTAGGQYMGQTAGRQSTGGQMTGGQYAGQSANVNIPASYQQSAGQMMNGDFTLQRPAKPAQKQGGGFYTVMAVIAVLVTLATAGIVWYYVSSSKEDTDAQSTPVAQQENTEEYAELDIEEYRVELYNRIVEERGAGAPYLEMDETLTAAAKYCSSEAANVTYTGADDLNNKLEDVANRSLEQFRLPTVTWTIEGVNHAASAEEVKQKLDSRISENNRAYGYDIDLNNCTKVGIGLSKASDGMYYWTVIFN